MHGILTQGWSTARLRGCRYRCSLPAHRYVTAKPSITTTANLKGRLTPCTKNTALMLDRLMSINDRIPLSPYVSLPCLWVQDTWLTFYFFFLPCLLVVAVGACMLLIRFVDRPDAPPERASRVSIPHLYRRSPSSSTSGVSCASPISRCVLSFLAFSFLSSLPLVLPHKTYRETD